VAHTLNERRAPSRELPTGTLTFLLTDAASSARLWEQHPEAMRRATRRHDDLIEHTVDEHGGVLVRPRGEGDSRFAVFTSPSSAVAAATAVQLAFHHEPWPISEPLLIRVGLHTGEADLRDGDYYGSTVNRCARLRGLAYGGQTLLSAATTQLVRHQLPSGVTLRSLGMHPLRGLAEPEPVYQVVHPELPSDFPPLRSPANLDNLPLYLTSLIGREDDVQRVMDLIRAARVVTLTGTGGVGKTRLGLEVAARMRDAFADGAWLVELAPLRDPTLVPQAVALTLNVPEARGHSLTDSLVLGLLDKDVLLVLDNCEHVVDACAAVVARLVTKCPHVHVLSTSREALDVAGERVWPVSMLRVPSAGEDARVEQLSQSNAVRLLVDRVTAVRPDFGLTQDNAPSAAEVCRRLDGLPLSIELAARRASTLSIEQIAERLRNSFEVLGQGSRTSPTRHRTLSATIDWSYDLLEPAQRTLFERISIFAGQFALSAVEEVCSGDGIVKTEVLELLEELVEASLVQMAVIDGVARYRLLAAVRQYAARRLQEHGGTANLRQRHAEFVLTLADEGGSPRHWLFSGFRFDQRERFEQEYDDVVAALEWLTSAGRTHDALRLATAVAWFWTVRGFGRDMLERLDLLLGLTPEMTVDRATALRAAGRLAWEQGDAVARERMSSEALAIFEALGDDAGAVVALQDLGSVAEHSGRYADAERFLGRSLAKIETRGLAPGLRPRSLMALAAVATNQGRFELARSHLDSALALIDAKAYANETVGLAVRANGLEQLALVAFYEGDFARAAELLQQVLRLRLSLFDRRERGQSAALLGRALLAAGDRESAVAYLMDSLALTGGVSSAWARVLGMEGLAALVAERHPAVALRTAGAADALRSAVARPANPMERRVLEQWLEPAHRLLGEPAAQAAWLQGHSLAPEVAISELICVLNERAVA
jgi:predicted ATPase/class 3 adenylate cyclase